MLEGVERLVGDLRLKKAEPLEALGVERGILIGHVLLEAAVDSGGLNLQGESERAHDTLATAAEFVRGVNCLAGGLLDLRVFLAVDLHLGDPGEVAPGHLVAKLLQRIDVRVERCPTDWASPLAPGTGRTPPAPASTIPRPARSGGAARRRGPWRADARPPLLSSSMFGRP